MFYFERNQEKLIYNVLDNEWFYEWRTSDFNPFRIRLEEGPRPFAATVFMRELRDRLPDIPDTLREIGVAAVVQLEALVRT